MFQQKSDLERTELNKEKQVYSLGYAINPVNGKEIPIWIATMLLSKLWYRCGYGCSST